ncbi:MAG: AMP-binding protein [Chromatiales bacterium]|nr:AMP-binding protein [Chromatiales bacterium]
MEKTWLRSYPPGMPQELELPPGETLVTQFDEAVRRFADRPAFSSLGRTISFAELDSLTARFAAFLQHELGMKPGARIALMLPNLLQYPVALYGALRAGLVVVNVNPLYTARELEYQLNDAEAEALVIVENRAHVAQKILSGTPVRHVIVTGIGDLLGTPRRWLVNFAVRWIRRMVPSWQIEGTRSFDDCLAVEPSRMSEVTRQPEDVAILQYTGGTTGRSKGAMLTHRNLVANVTQINLWFGEQIRQGEEIVLTALPLYHIYALTCNCLAYVKLGGHNILIVDPRDTRALIAEMRRWPISAMTGVNTLYQSLVAHPDLRTIDFSTLRLVSAGGMAVQESTAKRWADMTGTHIHEGYGLSETSPVVTSNPVTIEEWNGSIGLPLPGTEISLRDDEDNEPPQGDPGELCVRGPQVMAGYWRDPETTAESMTSDGFLRTGDMAVMDERGFFRIVDRKKDMISVSGLKVYPNEVENVLTQHGAIAEAAVIGVPDERTQEAVKAFVVLKQGQQTSEEEIRAFCRDRLSAYKIPHHVAFRDELPKSNVGKILRRELRDE